VNRQNRSTAKVITAFAAVYIIWGSTYLAIRYAIQTIPPLFMSSARFLIGGTVLYVSSRLRSGPSTARADWKTAFVLGALLLLFGNGGVAVAEQWVPSGLAAVLVSMVPVWVAVLAWIRPDGKRPSHQAAIGIILGLIGVIILIGFGDMRSAGSVSPFGATILVLSSISWAVGSLYGQHARVSSSPLEASGMQMLSGGTWLLIAGILTGETATFRPEHVSIRSLVAVLYLAMFGSIIAFTAYSWLLKATTPSRAATYAYVNPAVAVVLGWAVASEPLTPRMIVAMCVIVTSVMIITTSPRQ